MSNIYLVPFGMLGVGLSRIVITAEFVGTIIQRKRGRFYPSLRYRAAV